MSTRRPALRWFWAVLGIGVWLALVVGLYVRVFAVPRQVWDFEPLWAAARARFLEGLDPYGEAVTQRTMMAAYGRPALPGEDPRAFSYPLYALFLVLPLLPLPAGWARATWLALILVALVGAVVLVLPSEQRRRRALPLVFWALISYAGTWAVLLGQISTLVAVMLVLAWRALEQRRYGWAGFWLAWSTVKPNLVWLVLGMVLYQAWRRGHRRLIQGWLLTQGLLVSVALAWQPDWPWRFLQALERYARSRPFLPVVHWGLAALVPEPWDRAVYLGVALVLVAGLGVYVHRGRGSWSTHLALALALTFLITPRAHLADQVVLVPWLAAGMAQGWHKGRWGRALTVVIGAAPLGYWWVHGRVLASLTGPLLEIAQHRLLSPWYPLGLLGAGVVRQSAVHNAHKWA